MGYCINCLKQVEEEIVFCPYCGSEQSAYGKNQRALPPFTILNGQYLVGKVLGEGGFGITYMGLDLNLDQRVAIKEYYPTELASRETSAKIKTKLSVLSGGSEELYQKGLDRFVEEVENLARFNSLPGIVSVKDFFYENNTAYMVMEYIDGITLTQYLKEHGDKLPYTQVLDMMKPVMESLQTVHEAGIIHRDISPDNIMVTKDGMVKLIDFGAARFVGNNDAKSLTVILKHGYAPPEQYQTDGKQGPWTDVYALAATMYRMITGIVPQEATDRMVALDKLLAVNAIMTDVPKNISEAIMRGMNPKIEKRIRSVKELSELLYGKAKSRHNRDIAGVIAAAAVIFALIGGGIYFLGGRDESGNAVVAEQIIEIEKDIHKDDNPERYGNNEASSINNERKNTRDALKNYKETLNDMDIYKKFFYENYYNNDLKYYVMFSDINHDEREDMILVSEKDGYADNYYYGDCDDDRKIEIIWIVEQNVLCYAFSETNKGDYMICTLNNEDYFGKIEWGDNEYSISYLYFNGEEMVVADEKEYKLDNVGFSQYRIEPTMIPDIVHGIGIGSYSGLGTKMMQCYEPDRIFEDGYIDKVKRLERMVIDYSGNYDGIASVSFGDYDNDGYEEIGKLYASMSTDKYESDYTVVVEKEGVETVLAEFSSHSEPALIMNIKFGRVNSILVSKNGDNMGCSKYYNVFSWSNNLQEYVKFDDRYTFYNEEEYGFQGANEIHIDYEAGGKMYVLVNGDEQEIGVPGSSKYYFDYIEDMFIEYDSVPISIDELRMFSELDEEIGKAEAEIKAYTVDWSGYIFMDNAMYSSDDIVYINFSFVATDNDLWPYWDVCFAASFNIDLIDHTIRYTGFDEGRREFSSGLGIKPYTKEFSANL